MLAVLPTDVNLKECCPFPRVSTPFSTPFSTQSSQSLTELHRV